MTEAFDTLTEAASEHMAGLGLDKQENWDGAFSSFLDARRQAAEVSSHTLLIYPPNLTSPVLKNRLSSIPFIADGSYLR